MFGKAVININKYKHCKLCLNGCLAIKFYCFQNFIIEH